jgi:hypothetical protein
MIFSMVYVLAAIGAAKRIPFALSVAAALIV